MGAAGMTWVTLSGSLISCTDKNAGSGSPTVRAGNPEQSLQGQRITVVLPNSELAVGPNTRFLLGLLNKDNTPVVDAAVHLRFGTLSGSQIPQQAIFTPKFESDATFFTSPAIAERGLYVARVNFDIVGSWAVEVMSTTKDGHSETSRLYLKIDPKTNTPQIGTVPPASKTPVAKTVAEAEKICTRRPVDDMHDLSIGDVLGKGKPLAVLFATPAFCTSRLCGPDLDVVQSMKQKYGARVNFIHIEIYKDVTKPEQIVDTVNEWKLPSEPWLFLMDAQGKVVDKFEGGITTQELEPAIQKLAA